MTDKCTIGPISIVDPSLREGKSDTEFQLFIPQSQYIQLQGLLSKVAENESGHKLFLNSCSPYGLLPFYTSTSLTDNVHVQHKGYGLLTKLEPDFETHPTYVKASCEWKKLCNLDDYLSMNFTTGNSDGTVIEDGYDLDTTTMPNVVTLPVTTVLTTASDFTRASEDGNIPCYADPTYSTDLSFVISLADFFKGSVKAFEVVSGGTDIQICNTDYILDKTKFYIKNGLIKLETTTNSVKFYYWNGSAYTLLNEFVLGTINVIKLRFISPEKIELQLNKSKWTVWRGKPFVMIENHPAMTYTHKDKYYHDSTETSYTGTGQSITMQSQCKCLVYDTADTYRLGIIRSNQENITVDGIPASDLSALYFYNNSVTSTDPNGSVYLSLEFWKQVEQSIEYRQ